MHDPHFPYRADIDGLRAIAVLAVVIYHAFPEALPGGFVGVDIFFVISGFLITSILLREIADGSYSIGRFYGRRIKRLFPALALVLVVTLAIGWFVLFRDEFRQLGKHAAAGAAFISNITLWLETGYFDRQSELKPLLHLWSLGVEEQFYFVWPLIIALTVRARMNLTLVAASLGIASFAADILLVERDPTGTFFLPFARFWELMVGGLLASASLALPRRADASTSQVAGRLRELGAFVGLALIAAALVVVNESRPFPGWWTLFPTLGAALVIGAGSSTWISRRLLSAPAMIFVGLMSYPLYLWHWPLFSFARIICGAPTPPEVRLAIIALAVVLAWTTYRFIELPVRATARSPSGSRRVVSALGTALIAVFVTGLLVLRGFPAERLTVLSSLLSAARADWSYPGDKGARIVGTTHGTVLLLGDSYAQQLYPRFKEVAESHQRYRSIAFNTIHSCAPVPGIARKSDPKCAPTVERGFELAKTREVSTVVVFGSWLGLLKRGDYFRRDDPAETILDLYDPNVLDGVLVNLQETLKGLTRLGKQVVVVLNPPGEGAADPEAITGLRLNTANKLPVKWISMQEHLLRTGEINARIRTLAERAGAAVIDPTGWICDRERCFVTDEAGVPRFKDATHFRGSFVRCCIKDFDRLLGTY